ncbi:hypothetical protein BDB00DRAFT_799318 [Zychaea mexicana]|uniref:uncharacterized protein n=1 Tax=Zychaea mexicana TaxID=64656 RepID=UPI0022FE5ACB|nr:uncharacterized protein BDB00DRAFT_799318 [Zychaea mexicana]KAI9498739.1 hypothetical protein BDB00DRAFT_799318 [Zychaea mexicana]
MRSLDQQKQQITKDVLRVHLVRLLECPICCSCFYNPATAPCGHTFCQSCLVRSLDHMPSCPICRQSISWTPPPTPLLCHLVQALFPQQRQDELLQDSGAHVDDDKRVPILIGSLAFPHVRCVIHIFEPRYRLMLRRVMESRRRRFAMCLAVRRQQQPGASSLAAAAAAAPPTAAISMPFYEYGTMLELTHVQTLEDGRSVVQAVGSHRFRVVNHSMVDGYHVGELERVDDIDGEQEQALEREAIMRACAQRATLEQRQRQQQQQQTTTSSAATRLHQNHNRPDSNFINSNTNNLDRSSSQYHPPRPRSSMPGGAILPQQQQRSWAARAHPQTRMARSPWLMQMHLHGLSPAQKKPSPLANPTTTAAAAPQALFQTPTAASVRPPTPSSSSGPQPPSSPFNVTMGPSSTRHEETTTDDLIQQLASFIKLLRDSPAAQGQGSGSDRFAQLLRAFGDPPAIHGPRQNRAIFIWWAANMMPLNQEEKAKLLSVRMLRERVLMLVKWVDRFKDQWSFWLQCNNNNNNNNSNASSSSSSHLQQQYPRGGADGACQIS